MQLWPKCSFTPDTVRCVALRCRAVSRGTTTQRKAPRLVCERIVRDKPTAAAPASEVEAVVRSPTNMAAAKIAAVDFNKMTSK